MTTHETRRIDLDDVAVIELACKSCRTAITIHLKTWRSVFPARCPNCDRDWYLQDGPVTALRRLCDELRSVQRDAERAYHVRLVFERPTAEGDRDDG